MILALAESTQKQEGNKKKHSPAGVNFLLYFIDLDQNLQSSNFVSRLQTTSVSPSGKLALACGSICEWSPLFHFPYKKTRFSKI